MREASTHARNHDLSAAAEIFADGTYFPNSFVFSLENYTFCGKVGKILKKFRH
jgi:hypothetical protein